MTAENLDFSEALDLIKSGARVARSGWNGKGMWLSLTQYQDQTYMIWGFGQPGVPPSGVNVCAPWIGMRTADGKYVPWVASQTDLLAADWQEVAQ